MSRSWTGRRWRRPQRVCPPWCGGGHLCTAQHGYTCGEHRSQPLVWQMPYGRLIATRIAGQQQRSRLEVRAGVRLDRDEQLAATQALQLAEGVDAAIRRVYGLPPAVDLLALIAESTPPMGGARSRGGSRRRHWPPAR